MSAVHWYPIPFDEGVPKGAPSCQDGDEILVRIDGASVPVTCDRRHGMTALVGEDGADVEWESVDAIAHPPRRVSRSGRTRTYAEKQSAGLHRVSAELDEPTLRKLDELCADGGMSRADMIRAMIDAEWAEWRGLTSGRKTIAASKETP